MEEGRNVMSQYLLKEASGNFSLELTLARGCVNGLYAHAVSYKLFVSVRKRVINWPGFIVVLSKVRSKKNSRDIP
jgi:hypothetical protein